MFGKFMNKKFFHPGSYPNQKQKWVHQQRAEAKEKQENEKQATYQKEQETYQSRLLSAKTSEDKMKLDLNFLYDLPPGMKKDEEKEEGKEEEIKFEWQKNAPRSKYVKDLGLECQDQPFGICVKNIRCFKCRQWGHQNTDRECPLFFTDGPTSGSSGKSQADSLRLSDPLRLVAQMKDQHGITLKKSVIGAEIDPMAENQQLLDSDEGEDNLGDNDMAYIASLNDKEKKKLLKTLNKIQKSNKKKKKKKKKQRDQDLDSIETKLITHNKRYVSEDSLSEYEERAISPKRRRHSAKVYPHDYHQYSKASQKYEKNDLYDSDDNRAKYYRATKNKHSSQSSIRSHKRKHEDSSDNVDKLISQCRNESKYKK